MKYSYLHLGLLALLAVSCTITEVMEEEEPAVVSTHEVYHAVIDDSDGDPATRVYADNKLRVLWNADDRITLFERNTHGDEYVFIGEDGDNSGDFEYVASSSYGTGGNLDKVYAVYPYQKGTKISYDGVISYTLPNVQVYKEGSFGNGANVMVASTEKTLLNFKNAGGYLTVKLYGTNVSVASVYLTANDGTALAGPCSIEFSEGIPTLTMASENTVSKVRVSCPEPVTLGTSKTNYTEFWFVLPPVSLSEFTITVTTPDNKVFSQPVSLDVDIERNKVKRMPPLQVVPEESTESISLNGVSSSKNYIVDPEEPDENTDTFTITLPTVTDFSAIELNYDFDGQELYVGDKKIENGTPIDATNDVTLRVIGEYAEKHYTLKARNTGLPVVRIETSDFFSLEELESYPNSLDSDDGEDKRKWLPEAKKDFVSIRIEMPDGTEGMKKENGSSIYTADIKIKGRGNYTWRWKKKPYALKFDKRTEVLGMPAHKRWILLANFRDRTLLRNDATFWLSREAANMPYTVRGQFVELVFNGEHRGNYYLCEQIKIDPNRINIKEIDYGELGMQNTEEHTGGYLMEIDSYFDEVNKFKSKVFQLNYMFKEPDEEKLTDTDSLYMYNYIKDMETLIKSASSSNTAYKEYLDIDSAIKFMLLNELSGNRDFFQGYPHNGPHSTYLYKDEGSKLFMGPVWDFDYKTFIPASDYDGRKYSWRGFRDSGYYYYYLCNDPTFVTRIKELWAELKTNSESALLTYIDAMAAKLTLSQKLDEKLWPFLNETNRNDNNDYELPYIDDDNDATNDAIGRMKASFTARLNWMDGKITSNKFPNN